MLVNQSGLDNYPNISKEANPLSVLKLLDASKRQNSFWRSLYIDILINPDQLNIGREGTVFSYRFSSIFIN